jgi:hypothetical protein
MEKEFNVIEISPTGNKQWGGGAYTIAFLYTKSNGNLIVKGYYDEVKDYINNNYTHYFINYTLWSKYGFRSIWRFWKDGYYIHQPDRKRDKPTKYYKNTPRYKWEFIYHDVNDVRRVMEFRRFPKRWIKEFDNIK